jgi:hypothetical protein
MCGGWSLDIIMAPKYKKRGISPVKPLRPRFYRVKSLCDWFFAGKKVKLVGA